MGFVERLHKLAFEAQKYKKYSVLQCRDGKKYYNKIKLQNIRDLHVAKNV